MNIGIIGIGVVGSALLKDFEIKNINVNSYDKYKNIGNFFDILNSDIVFLCLPTPYSDTLHEYDKSSIYDVCSKLYVHEYTGLVVVKSTVEPEFSQSLVDKYNGLNICHNPEFLTAKTAFEDFKNQDHIVIGKTLKSNGLNKLITFYENYYPNAKINICNSNESELMKLGVNNFYSVKIQFFNELYLLSEKMDNIDYNIVKNLMLFNGWINPMHTEVPGSDGNLSYGGMCFPKDTNALLQFMKKKNSNCKVLEGTVEERNSMRND